MTRVFGRVGRAWIRPLLWRQRRCGGSILSHRLRLTLQWWLALLEAEICYEVLFAQVCTGLPDVLVYTDAERKGGAGVVVVWCKPHRVEYSMGSVPQS